MSDDRSNSLADWHPSVRFVLSGRPAKPPALNPLKVNLKAMEKWIDEQKEPYTGPRAIRGMIETILHIVSKDPGEKPAKKAMGK